MQTIEEQNIKEAVGQRGNILLIHNNYKFSQHQRMMKGELKWRCPKWRCPNQKCRAFLITLGESGARFIVDSDFNHNHSPYNERRIRLAAVAAAAKQKFSKQFDSATEETVDKCLMEFTDLKQEDLDCIRKALSNVQKRKMEGDPTSSNSNRSKELVSLDKTEDVSEKSHSGNESLDLSKIKTRPESNFSPFAPPAGQSRHDFSNEYDVDPEQDGCVPLKFRDEYDVSGWVYGNTLRSLDPTQRLIFENLVSDLISKAKLNKLTVKTKVVLINDSENEVSSSFD